MKFIINLKEFFGICLFIVMATSAKAGDISGTCIDENIANEANYHLSIDPITTKNILSNQPDCDEKYALIHRANVEIAKKCRDDFYYGDKIYPKGRYNWQTPNIYEKHVMENSDQFESAHEGTYRIIANDYWIKKIKNSRHQIIADYEYERIMLYYDGVQEDGDGSKHNEDLIIKFSEWIKKYPENDKVPLVEKLIDHLKGIKRNN